MVVSPRPAERHRSGRPDAA